MNDPHVERLHYRIKHDQAVNYKRAPAQIRDTPLFTARVESDRAVLEMKTHFAREGEAKAAVAPLLRAWEVWAGLERSPGEFEFTYESGDVVDRRPEPGAGVGRAAGRGYASGAGAFRISRDTYPEAPDHFEVSPEVELMYSRYEQYRQGKLPLSHFAYFIYTAIKGGARRQQTGAAKKFGIDNAVLSTLNTLSSEKGGRKYEGAGKEFTAAETRWLEEVVNVIIQRAGEVEASPGRNQPRITMKNLRDLG